MGEAADKKGAAMHRDKYLSPAEIVHGSLPPLIAYLRYTTKYLFDPMVSVSIISIQLLGVWDRRVCGNV
jgi:hypothetical protein